LAKAEAAAARQSDHPLVGSQCTAEEQFDAVGRRFAFDFLEQGRADAKMLPVIGNRHAEFAGAFRARKRHPRLPIGADRDPANEESERLNDGSFVCRT